MKEKLTDSLKNLKNEIITEANDIAGRTNQRLSNVQNEIEELNK
jgi:hypothetical protein